MNELISGVACCNLTKKTNGEDGYNLKFSAGRLLGALIVIGVGFGADFGLHALMGKGAKAA